MWCVALTGLLSGHYTTILTVGTNRHDYSRGGVAWDVEIGYRVASVEDSLSLVRFPKDAPSRMPVAAYLIWVSLVGPRSHMVSPAVKHKALGDGGEGKLTVMPEGVPIQYLSRRNQWI